MRKHPGGRVSFALKFSVYYFGGAGAFVPFWLFRPSPAAGPTPYAPRLVFGFARSAITPTEHAETPDRDEAGDSHQSSHLKNHALTSVPGREGGSSVAQASQAARGADRGHQNIGGLQVAVENPLRMRGLQGSGDSEFSTSDLVTVQVNPPDHRLDRPRAPVRGEEIEARFRALLGRLRKAYLGPARAQVYQWKSLPAVARLKYDWPPADLARIPPQFRCAPADLVRRHSTGLIADIVPATEP